MPPLPLQPVTDELPVDAISKWSLPGRAVLGLLLAIGVALAGRLLAWQMDVPALNPLCLALLMGVALAQTPLAAWIERGAVGISLARNQLLRAGVALYGLQLLPAELLQLGLHGLTLAVCVVIGTLALAGWAGPRWLGMDRVTALLVGAGTAICGAAAVLAVAPVLRARAEQTVVALATVVLFGTLAMFLEPALQSLTGEAPATFGLFMGATIHEVAQVVAAAQALGPEAVQQAVAGKLLRVLLLGPVLLVLVWRSGADTRAARPKFPGFVVAFLGLVVLNGVLGDDAQPLRQVAGWVEPWLLGVAMAGIGLQTRLQQVRSAGQAPLLLAALLLCMLLTLGYGIHRLLLILL